MPLRPWRSFISAVAAIAAIAQLASICGAVPSAAARPPATTGVMMTLDPRYDLTHVNLSDSATSLIGPAEVAQAISNAAPCVGAVADGATKILLEYPAPATGKVTFTVATSGIGGALRRIDSMSAPDDVPTVQVNGQQVAVAIYTVPDGLPAGDAAAQETVQFRAVFTAPGTGSISSTGTLAILRPPVLLVHGLWSSPETWLNATGPYAALQAAGFTTFLTDYGDTNTASLFQNRYVLMSDPGGILDVYAYDRSQGVAITRVDVVAHSMGGLIARELVAWPAYKSKLNYNQGYIRRLVAIAAPNDGSPLASLLEQIQTEPAGQVEARFLAKIGYPTGPAMADLEPGSKALSSIGATSVAAFAEVGEYEAGDNPGILGEAYALLGQSPSTVFGGAPNDLVVSDASQEGGIGAFKIEPHLTHLTETGSAAIGADVVGLLEGPAGAFALGFPAPSPAPTAISAPEIRASTPAFATLTSPKPNQLIGPGHSITVSVAAAPGVMIAGIVAAATSHGTLIALQQSAFSSPTTATLTTPVEAIGPVAIEVLVEDTLGQVCLLGAPITVVTNQKATAVAVEPAADVLTSQGSTVGLQVLGVFPGAVSRDITGQSTTVYSSSNPTSASVGKSGLVTALADGDAVITVTSGNQSAKANITVALASPIIFSVTPSVLSIGKTTHVVINGANLGGASEMQLLSAGSPDTAVSATNLVVGSQGRSLSGNITVSPSDSGGTRVLVVTTPGGQSDPLAPGTSVNVVLK